MSMRLVSNQVRHSLRIARNYYIYMSRDLSSNYIRVVLCMRLFRTAVVVSVSACVRIGRLGNNSTYIPT